MLSKLPQLMYGEKYEVLAEFESIKVNLDFIIEAEIPYLYNIF